jgi:hypothetical protein
MTFKNSGKTTEIRIGPGLPKDSQPANRSLFESVRTQGKLVQKGSNAAITYDTLYQQASVSSVAAQIQGLRLPPNGSNSSLNKVSNAALVNYTGSLASAAAAKKRPPPPPKNRQVPRVEALYVRIEF